MAKQTGTKHEGLRVINGLTELLNNPQELERFSRSAKDAMEIAKRWGLTLGVEEASYLSGLVGSAAGQLRDAHRAIALAIAGPPIALPDGGSTNGGDGPNYIEFHLIFPKAIYEYARYLIVPKWEWQKDAKTPTRK